MKELHARARKLFLEAVESDEPRRQLLLEQASREDPRLREEVESLLAHHHQETILPDETIRVEDDPRSTSRRAVSRRPLPSLAGQFTQRFLGGRRRRYAATSIAAIVLIAAGSIVYATILRTVKRNVGNQLSAMLAAQVEAIEIWFQLQQATAEAIAGDALVRELIQVQLAVDPDGEGSTGALLENDALVRLRREIEPLLQAHGYEGFVVIDASSRIVAATEDSLVGDRNLARGADELSLVFGERPRSVVSLPFASRTILPDVDDEWRAGVPTMFALAPVRNGEGDVIAALGLRIRPERDFTRILQVAQPGNSGESLAIDADGWLLSESRFNEQLQQAGLVARREPVRSILQLQLRNPGVDLTRGRRPKTARQGDWPLTRMTRSATAGEDGLDVSGYRDYRGVPVVGAWTWLERHQLGVATKLDAAEALAPLRLLNLVFGFLFLMLVTAVAISFGSSFTVLRLRKEVIDAREVGPYRLEKMIGEGGMGRVYLARHALLKRPTAVKLLRPDRMSSAAVARFEREVQLASSLTHPNTIEIYDFGRTPDGLFYYAMEYLPGISLAQLIERTGGVPAPRAVFLLQQVARSLQEAHSVGLIHRDVKPQNIFVCERGGEFDFIKLLDFGLVKQVDGPPEWQVTTNLELHGTPLYIAPEQLQGGPIDHRVDIYAFGVVSFFLLTGRPPFSGTTVIDQLHQTLHDDGPRPSEVGDVLVPPALDELVATCLAKDPGSRCSSFSVILEELRSDWGFPTWSQSDARTWWKDHA